MERVLLVDRDPLSSSVDLARRGMDNALDFCPARRLEHVQRSLDIRRNELAWMAVGVRDRDQRAEVQHELAVLERASHCFRVREIAPKDLELADDLGIRGLEPAVVAARRVAD